MTRDAIRGASATTVHAAIDEAVSLPGTSGFAGALGTTVSRDAGQVVGGRGGRVVRDVLGRQPVFVDGDHWSFDPARLDDPRSVEAGCVVDLASGAETRVWTLPDPPEEPDHDAAIDRVRGALQQSVETVVSDDVAIAFSGGVDSAFVASGLDGPCIVVGFPDSHDVAAAREASAAMERDLHVVELTHDDLVRAVPQVVAATGRTNPMDIQIALPLHFAGEYAADAGYRRLAVGQGADELFGGYSKVVSPADDHRVDARTVRGARRETIETLPRQLERDVRTLRAAGVEPVAPFLADGVVQAALPLPGALLATDQERKIALRRAVADSLPPAVVSAEKKAVQYGSLVSRELDRLARQAGYKRRMDDHVGQYIRSLVDA